MNIKIVNKSGFDNPEYATSGSAGFDLKAFIETPITIAPMERAIIPTGLFMEIPVGFEGQIRPRSGLAAKHGITVLNTPGTIDSDYQGEIKIILINLSQDEFMITSGDRIAQMIIAAYEHVRFDAVESVDHFNKSDRGAGGIGSTGK